MVEEKVTFDLKLIAFKPRGKIQVFKEVRSVIIVGRSRWPLSALFLKMSMLLPLSIRPLTELFLKMPIS